MNDLTDLELHTTPGGPRAPEPSPAHPVGIWIVAAVLVVADGATPAKHLKVLRPSPAFRIVERQGIPYVDPRSYDRYATIADAVASINPAGAARLYATLKPRIEEAHRDLGALNQPFDRTLERAIL